MYNSSIIRAVVEDQIPGITGKLNVCPGVHLEYIRLFYVYYHQKLYFVTLNSYYFSCDLMFSIISYLR